MESGVKWHKALMMIAGSRRLTCVEADKVRAHLPGGAAPRRALCSLTCECWAANLWADSTAAVHHILHLP